MAKLIAPVDPKYKDSIGDDVMGLAGPMPLISAGKLGMQIGGGWIRALKQLLADTVKKPGDPRKLAERTLLGEGNEVLDSIKQITHLKEFEKYPKLFETVKEGSGKIVDDIVPNTSGLYYPDLKMIEAFSKQIGDKGGRGYLDGLSTIIHEGVHNLQHEEPVFQRALKILEEKGIGDDFAKYLERNQLDPKTIEYLSRPNEMMARGVANALQIGTLRKPASVMYRPDFQWYSGQSWPTALEDVWWGLADKLKK
jgi:hypothetical protein